MQAIKQIVRTPGDHEVRIKIPEYVPENDPVEIILLVSERSRDFGGRIDQLRAAVEDELFLSDLVEVSGEFDQVELREWTDQLGVTR